MLNNNDNTEVAELQPATDLIPPDGADWDEENLGWIVRFDGDEAGWGYRSQQAAWDAYNEMLRVYADHKCRSIPVLADGELVGVLYLDTCPDCGIEYQRCACPEKTPFIPFNGETWPIPEPVTAADQYSIEIPF